MCIAIVKPLGTTISRETLEECFRNNKDWCGFAYINKGKVIISKGYDTFESFYSEYKKVENRSNMLIHFRIATHGGVNIKSTHPFYLNTRMAIIHNGIISGYGDKENKSDTVDWIETIGRNISWKMWKNPAFRKIVGDSIGYSKFAILDQSGEFFIINEHKGIWDNGVWFSNRSYEIKKYEPVSYEPYTYYNTGKYYSGYKKIDNGQVSLLDKKENETKDCVIYRCGKCGTIFYEDWDVDAVCNVCNTLELPDEIGYRIEGVDYFSNSTYLKYATYQFGKKYKDYRAELVE